MDKAELLRSETIDELQAIADLYRRKSRYKRYSSGMKSAFKNRAVGIETSIKTIERVMTSHPL